jgi:hypothetical protein
VALRSSTFPKIPDGNSGEASQFRNVVAVNVRQEHSPLVVIVANEASFVMSRRTLSSQCAVTLCKIRFLIRL